MPNTRKAKKDTAPRAHHDDVTTPEPAGEEVEHRIVSGFTVTQWNGLDNFECDAGDGFASINPDAAEDHRRECHDEPVAPEPVAEVEHDRFGNVVIRPDAPEAAEVAATAPESAEPDNAGSDEVAPGSAPPIQPKE